MERAKVEVHLHQTHLDGSFGQVIIGPNRGGVQLDRDAAAEHPMKWLRNYVAGSPAPMPCGEVLAINQKGLVSTDDFTGKPIGDGFLPYDLSPLPNGQVVCTSLDKTSFLVFDPVDGEVREVVNNRELEVRDLHSVVHLASRPIPAYMHSTITPEKAAPSLICTIL